MIKSYNDKSFRPIIVRYTPKSDDEDISEIIETMEEHCQSLIKYYFDIIV